MLAFALPPLAVTREVPAADLFRHRIDPPKPRLRPSYLAITAGAAAALAALAVFTASDRWFAAWFVGGTVATLLVLRLGALLVERGAARLGRVRAADWRLALANLHRPGAATPGVMQSLGTGLAVLVAVALIEGNLNLQLAERLPEEAPAFFFIDIQPDQAAAFDAVVAAVPGTRGLRRVPSVRGRIVEIAGVPVEAAAYDTDVAWAVRGDRSLTYAALPPEDAAIVGGQWWPADYRGPPLISLDAGLAQGFHVGVGDTLTLNVLGRRVTATIASLREIDWRSLRFDFAIVFSPGVLEGAPQTHIAAVRVPPAAEEALEAAVSDTFANISAIRVRDALEAARRLLAGIGGAVRGTALVTLVTGVVVLAGAIAAGRQRRGYEAVVLKVLGANPATGPQDSPSGVRPPRPRRRPRRHRRRYGDGLGRRRPPHAERVDLPPGNGGGDRGGRDPAQHGLRVRRNLAGAGRAGGAPSQKRVTAVRGRPRGPRATGGYG